MRTAGWRASVLIEDRREEGMLDAAGLTALIEQDNAPIMTAAPDLGAAEPSFTVLFYVAVALIQITRRVIAWGLR